MVATQKAESESKESHERVRARTTVEIEPRERAAELGQQIAQLMAALTQT